MAAAERADELLARWAEREGQEPRAAWAVDLSYVLLQLGRGAEFVDALTPMVWYSPWVEGAVALADGLPVEAAEIFTEMGTRPFAALAQLEAGRALDAAGKTHLEAAASFWRSVGATAYVNEAEALRAAAG